MFSEISCSPSPTRYTRQFFESNCFWCPLWCRFSFYLLSNSRNLCMMMCDARYLYLILHNSLPALLVVFREEDRCDPFRNSRAY